MGREKVANLVLWLSSFARGGNKRDILETRFLEGEPRLWDFIG